MKWIKKHRFLLAVLVVMILAFVVCFVIARGQQIWFDEAYSIMISKFDLKDTVSLTSVDAHPPLYYILLHFWSGALGFDEMTLRVLSMVFYSASIGLMLVLLSKLFGKKVAITAAPFLLMAPFLLRYGFEIRMYSLASLIAVGSTLVLYYARKTGENKYWIIYAILVALGMYTLYMMALVFLAHVVLLTVGDVKAKKLDKKWVFAYLGAVILYIPWIVLFLSRLSDGGAVLSGANIAFGWKQLVEVVSYGILYKPMREVDVGDVMLLVMSVLIIVMAVVVVVKTKLLNRKKLGFLAGMFLIPIVIFAIVANPLFGLKIYLERYLAHFIIFGYAGLGVVFAVLTASNRKKNMLTYVWMLLVLTFGTVNLVGYGNRNFQRDDKSEAREVAEVLNSYCEAGKEVLVDDLYVYIEVAPYMSKKCNYKYFAWEDVEYRGGYAPLSLMKDKMVVWIGDIDNDDLVIMTEKDAPLFDTTDAYELREKIGFDYHNVFVYKKSEV